jgi:predicted ATPase
MRFGDAPAAPSAKLTRMPHLMRVSLKRAAPSEAYPFSVPAVRALEPLEGIAVAAELTTLGSDDVSADDTLVPARALAESRMPEGERPALATAARHTDGEQAARFVASRDRRSHGESFMDVFEKRVHPGGLYLLDEPEAPLSPARQIDLLNLMLRM